MFLDNTTQISACATERITRVAANLANYFYFYQYRPIPHMEVGEIYSFLLHVFFPISPFEILWYSNEAYPVIT
jgi:hypothetical protein